MAIVLGQSLAAAVAQRVNQERNAAMSLPAAASERRR
jgi:hypothetical protein